MAASSSFKMGSMRKFSYQRLGNEAEFGKEDEERASRKIRKWSRYRKAKFRKRPSLRIQKLRRFWRKRAKLFSTVKVSWSKILKRLKNGQVHMNDLFAGNYMFMQANPAFNCGLPSRYSLGKMY